MGTMTAAQVIELKAKIKADMARRNGYGSLSTDGGYNYARQDEAVDYSSADFDFTVAPEAYDRENESESMTFLAEHGQKTVDLLLQINDHGDLKPVEQGEPIPAVHPVPQLPLQFPPHPDPHPPQVAEHPVPHPVVHVSPQVALQPSQ